MRLMEPVTYSLQLNTGERIDILEIDPDRVPILNNDTVRAALLPILQHCSHVTRLSIEEAKKHHPRKLETLLRTPPLGALIKLNRLCAQIEDCPSSGYKECITGNVAKKYGKFPICWEYAINEKLPDNEMVVAKDLATQIVHAWRNGRYVLIVSS